MSTYRCVNCDNLKDADIHGCNEHPANEFTNRYNFGCYCDECITDLEEGKESCCISECYD